jgi:type II secretory pathway pseudopilin PulG
MVGVVVAIAIIVILLAAVGPTVATIIERDREKELIFRGKQYARAVLAFQKRYGRFPNELTELSKLKPRSIRKLWKDPMCNCDDWQIIIVGSPEAVPMGNAPPPPGGSGPGLNNRTPRPDQTTPGFGSDLTPTPGFLGGGERVPVTPTPGSIFGPATGKPVGPIMGVRSKVRRKTIFEWRGRSYTDEWRFLAGDADNENGPSFDPNLLRGRNFTPPPSGR